MIFLGQTCNRKQKVAVMRRTIEEITTSCKDQYATPMKKKNAQHAIFSIIKEKYTWNQKYAIPQRTLESLEVSLAMQQSRLGNSLDY